MKIGKVRLVSLRQWDQRARRPEGPEGSSNKARMVFKAHRCTIFHRAKSHLHCRRCGGRVFYREELQKATPAGHRWITVHPNGPDTKGVPIMVKENKDGTWSVVAGAGGHLNYLRLPAGHLKSEEEYRQKAAKEAKRKREVAKEEALRRHEERVFHYGKEAAAAQEKHERELKSQLGAEVEAAQQKSDWELVDKVAAAQGWENYKLQEEDLAGLDVKVRAKVEKAHLAALKAKAKAVEDQTRVVVLATHEKEVGEALGDVEIGDLVQDTYGDTGKGYLAGTQKKAADRGLTAGDVAVEKKDVSWQGFLERNDGDLGAAIQAANRTTLLHEAAADAREELKHAQKTLNELGLHQTAVAELETTPQVETLAEAAELLSAAKKHEMESRALRGVAKEISEKIEVEKLPTGVSLLPSAPLKISEADALKAVQEELEQSSSRKVASALLDEYQKQGQVAPLREHLLSGHNDFFNSLTQALGDVGEVDRFAADTLGPAATADLIAARMREKMSSDQVKRVQEGLAKRHAEGAERVAQKALETAREKLNAAENIEVPAFTDDDSLVAAQDQNHKRLLLERDAREELGYALGHLEAAAAFNDALMRPKKQLEVPLGAISSPEAIARARALGLEVPEYEAGGFRAPAEGPTGPADYSIHSDGKNKVLSITAEGMKKLTETMQTDPEVSERARRAQRLRSGAEDEPQWLPAGISRRPQTSFDDLDAPPPIGAPDLPVLHRGMDAPAMTEALKEHIGARIDAGQDPVDIASDLHSADYIASLGLTPQGQEQYLQAVQEVAPRLASVTGNPAERAAAMKQHRIALAIRMSDYADAFVEKEVKAGRRPADARALDTQMLPNNEVTRDLLFQAVAKDPRTRAGLKSVGSLEREDRAAIRSYFYEKVAGLDPQNEQPVQALSPEERTAWESWKGLTAGGKDPYEQIQSQWRKREEAGGGMFGAPEPHVFATVSLGDDQAVIAAAKQHAKALGYEPETRPVLENGRPVMGKFEQVIPELEVINGNGKEVAVDARRRIRAELRKQWLQAGVAPALAEKAFNPEGVRTASDRWSDYVADMGGENRAIATVQEFMRGEVAGRVASGYKQLTGNDLRVANRPIEHASAHAEAMLPYATRPERMEAQQAATASEMAALRQRQGGKFASGEVKSAVEAARAAQAEQQSALFGGGSALLGGGNTSLLEEEAPTEGAAPVHRLSLGRAAENMLASMAPHLPPGSKPVAAAGNINMSDGQFVKQQRAVKEISQNKRLHLALGVGSGKTLIGIGGFTEAHARGQAQRGLFVVPSVVQGQFGSEMFKFTEPGKYSWFADPSANASQRRAAYADSSGHDMVVVTHQAFRDDITWAVSQHLGVTEKEAAKAIRTLPEEARRTVIQEAIDKQGWSGLQDYVNTDESHAALSRKGKPDSLLTNVLDAVTSKAKHYVSMSADPIKNDPSEAWDLLHKIAPDKYTAATREPFLNKYGVNPSRTAAALAREMSPYILAGRVDPGVAANRQEHLLAMTEPQRAARKQVLSDYNAGRRAHQQGGVDVEAMRRLSPNSFADAPPEEHERIAGKLQGSLGIVRDAALNRVVNMHPAGVKLERVAHIAQQHQGQPGLVFAHNLEAVRQVAERLRKEGLRVGMMTGGNSSQEKEAIRLGFQPASGRDEDAKFDVLVTSDAGAVGQNLQRGQWLVNYDTPDTAMVHEQRIGRIHRVGQKNDVAIHDLIVDTPSEHTSRRRLALKTDLRERLTSPSELLDDTGLMNDLSKIHEEYLQAKVRMAADMRKIMAGRIGLKHRIGIIVREV